MRPEQPPGWTATRRRRSSRPSCSRRLLTLPAAVSVRPTPWVDSSVFSVSVTSVMYSSGRVGATIVRAAPARTAGSSAAAFEACEEQRLARDRPLEYAEVLRLVGRVRARVGVLDAGHQDLRGRERLDQLGDK